MSFTTNEDLAARLAARLDPLSGSPRPTRNEFAGGPNPALARPEEEGGVRALTPAAVLAPIVKRPEGWTVLLTKRTESMPTHAGQTAFPGGRVQPEDGGPVQTALRETLEEIGLHPRYIEPLGRTESYETGTGYEIVPIVAYVAPGFSLTLDEREVDSAFEIPVAFLFDPANHIRREGEFRGVKRSFYEMIHGERRVWGATAGMIRILYERLYEEDA
jgi:8-oxo-dGTP pyrophosphatase MutT (NUDIX family)